MLESSRTAVVVSLLLFLCDGGAAAQLALGPRDCGVQASPDAEWASVLKSGVVGGVSSRMALKSIAARDGKAASTLLAKTILFLWDPAKERFHSPTPRALDFRSPTREELKEFLPDPTEAGIVVVEVEVSQSGIPERARLLKGSGKQALDRLIVCRALSTLYCPAKSADGYMAGKVALRVLIEVR